MFDNEILKRLMEMRDSGMTQQDISDKTGVSRPYINQLLNSKKSIRNLELETFFKLFPNAKIVFDDSRQIGDVKNNTNSPVIQGDGNTVGLSAGEETASEFLRRIMESSDIDAETKVKLYNMLNGN